MLLSLKHSHDNKIIHRDLKTANIFLTSENSIKLGDFGLAKNLRNSNHMLNEFMGTPLYLSPEIIENKAYSFKSDIWSLGIIFYEILNLSHPFKSKNFGELVDKIKNGKLPALNNFYSEELRFFVKSLLIKDVRLRPSIDDLLENDFILKNLVFFKNEFKTLVRMNKKNCLKISEVDLVKDLNSLKTYRFSQYTNTNQILKDIQGNGIVKKSQFFGNSEIQENYESQRDLGNFFEEMKKKDFEKKKKNSFFGNGENFTKDDSFFANKEKKNDKDKGFFDNEDKFEEDNSFFEKSKKNYQDDLNLEKGKNINENNSFFQESKSIDGKNFEENSYYDKNSICKKNNFFENGENFEEENSFFNNEKSVYDKIDNIQIEEKKVKNKKSKFYKKNDFFSSELEEIEFKEEENKNNFEKKNNNSKDIFLSINEIELETRNDKFLKSEILKKSCKKQKKNFGLITTKLKTIMDLEKNKKIKLQEKNKENFENKKDEKFEKTINEKNLEKLEKSNFEFYGSEYCIQLNYSEVKMNSEIEFEKKKN